MVLRLSALGVEWLCGRSAHSTRSMQAQQGRVAPSPQLASEAAGCTQAMQGMHAVPDSSSHFTH